jgi:rhomboid family GlyGly-CTERM serine protease
MGLRQVTQTALSGALWPTLCLLTTSALVLLAGEPARLLLRYDRGGIADLEFHRLLTGHIVHLGASHFLLNAAGLLLIAVLVGPGLTATGWWFVIAMSTTVIDVSFWLFGPTIEWYVGLSGVLHGMLAAGACAAFRTRRVESTAIMIALTAKLIYEQTVGPLPGSELSSGGSVVVDSHLYGAVGGVLAIVILAGFKRRTSV